MPFNFYHLKSRIDFSEIVFFFTKIFSLVDFTGTCGITSGRQWYDIEGEDKIFAKSYLGK